MYIINDRYIYKYIYIYGYIVIHTYIYIYIYIYIKQMCKERKLDLRNHSKRTKSNHLNRGKLHLNQRGLKVLVDAFLKEMSNVFN